ncbi:MAG: immunoglobulin domain-containing protein, partial [Verrucomicrobiales bacterium]|nr:immunoglobulin domain-containing protein [Verrucomicrobiales bacterium]
MAAAVAVQMASAQEITAKWYQSISGTVGVAEADRLPILKKQGTPSENLNGTDEMDAYRNLIRYDATRLLLGVGENGINESDPNLSAADKALAEAYPDRSLIWLDAETGKPLGVAFKESFRPDLLAGKDVTTAGQSASYAWWRVALDQGPAGDRALYSAFKHLILRYAPKAGGGWESTPTVAYEEQVGGVGDGLSNGDGSTSWRFRDFHVRGSGVNTVIYAGGGTWRAGHHPQVLVTTDGLNYKPKARVDNRDNGARRNDYALGGISSFPIEVPNTYGGDPNNPKISFVIAGHYPGTGWEARPNRYASNPDNPVPAPAYNAQPGVVVYTRNETGFAGLPAFSWEAAGKDGRPLDYTVDGTTRYDGNWNAAVATDAALDYIVAYSMPSWNNVLPKIDPTADEPTPHYQTPAWLAVHRFDGSIASGNSSFKLDFRENDEPIEDQQTEGNAGGPVGHDYLYDPWIELVPDATVPGKAEALVSFGPAGFGVFTIQNVGAALVSSPANQTVAAGTDVVIAANVTGSPNSFQWYKDGQPIAAGAQYVGTTRKVALTIKSVTGKDAGSYQLKWSNPVSGPGQTAEATLTVNNEAVRLTAVQIQPEGLPITIPAGSVTATGDDSFTVAGPGLVAFPSASNANQPGDVQEFAYESVTGDFDKIVKIASITSGPVTDPVDAQAAGGLEARVSTDPVSPSFLVNASNPLGANQVQALGRAILGQNYTVYGRAYPGVDKDLPNQWLRLRRVGDWFSAYVGTDGKTWSLIGQRYQQWPATLLVGTYAFSASYVVTDGTGSGGENLATVAFSNYGNHSVQDTVPPTLVSVGTTDKKVIGVKFSEAVNSASALIALNYKLSEGSVTGVRAGIGGDTVYLSVSGLTSDTFTVTVLGGVTDVAGNSIAANSAAQGKLSNWSSADVGYIQDAASRPTPGDDPYRVGQAVATSSGDTETEIEIVGGGSNAWNAGDYIHY